MTSRGSWCPHGPSLDTVHPRGWWGHYFIPYIVALDEMERTGPQMDMESSIQHIKALILSPAWWREHQTSDFFRIKGPICDSTKQNNRSTILKKVKMMGFFQCYSIYGKKKKFSWYLILLHYSITVLSFFCFLFLLFPSTSWNSPKYLSPYCPLKCGFQQTDKITEVDSNEVQLLEFCT